MPGGDPPNLQLLAIAKAPLTGEAKTRLCPPFTPEQAARLAGAALGDTLDAMSHAPARARSVAFNGDPAPWIPAHMDILRQRGEGLDERLAAAFEDAWAAAPVPTLLIGMDTPQAGPELLAEAGQRLLAPGVDAVFGPATDGGWWALGLRRPDPELLLGVPMSTGHTGADQRARLRGKGLTVTDLPVLTDVDTAEDAAAVAAAAPLSRFAAMLADVSVDRSSGGRPRTQTAID